jgi:murein L,D-transpeptidase YafK
MRNILILTLLMLASCCEGRTADLVVVEKSRHLLILFDHGKAFATFHVAFGANPHGHKQEEGDNRTPEGRYMLDLRKENDRYHHAIHISYPNAADRANAKTHGVSPGGDVMVHGQRNGFGWAAFVTQHFDWTHGCIAMSNDDLDKVWDAVPINTPIEIRP